MGMAGAPPPSPESLRHPQYFTAHRSTRFCFGARQLSLLRGVSCGQSRIPPPISYATLHHSHHPRPPLARMARCLVMQLYPAPQKQINMCHYHLHDLILLQINLKFYTFFTFAILKYYTIQHGLGRFGCQRKNGGFLVYRRLVYRVV